MQVLRAVVANGSVSGAAAALGYTPSAISQQIGVLEREAGTRLLEKVGRGLRPTPAGALLAERAGALAELLGGIEAELADIRAGRTGLLRVRFFHTASVGLIPPAVAAFRTGHPDVQLDLRMQEDGLLEAVSAGECDVAVIVAGRDVPQPKGVQMVHLVDDPYRIVLPGGHGMAGQQRVELAELAAESWISSVPTTAGPCAEALQDAYACAGISPRAVLEVDGSHSAQGFVAAGLGVALVPQLGLEAVHPDVVVRPLGSIEPVRRIFAAVRETVADRPATEQLLAALTGAAAPGPVAPQSAGAEP
ncbi:LysR family transcriptional regulator [Saccharopolyspora sp. HNM0983]|uniref:LysR family transcriptional regulator n=2 Tax=Saccharopolyspora montiporae TaxID=2781240 RepID=A0A929BCP0_9PSEU|nr:LysR family transcriptional regulator [Saccharopolyspora sp. HNM0983]MBE9375072.1 LysR family transcriptional regulator [Saccharopolyspora sp. HNM0983]